MLGTFIGIGCGLLAVIIAAASAYVLARAAGEE